MEVLTQIELNLRLEQIIKKIKQGAVFIHPTDTIYGIGCTAEDETAVAKIRRLKEQHNQPFSVWVPSLKWVEKNCQTDKKTKEGLKQLPGPYTLIIRLKNKNAVAKSVTLGKGTIGIRYPNHWFGKIVEACELPIITTSANKTGQPFMTLLENLDEDIQKGVDFMIYEGEKKGRPSKIINLIEGKVTER
ncbi:MAG: L-threonylcarbamoyladenylate synthase [Nanoarchaeota archaeon]